MKACSCITSIALSGLVSVLAVGCAESGSGDSGVVADHAVTGGLPATGLCSDPAPTADGQWLLLDVCPSGSQPGRLVLRRVDALTSVELATYPATSKITYIVQNGEGFAAVLLDASGAFDVIAGRANPSSPVTRVDVSTIAGASAREPKALHVTADGKWLLGVSGATSVLFVTELGSGNVVTKDLRSGAGDHRFVSKDSRALLVSARSEQNALGRAIALGGSATIGEPVDLKASAYAVVGETFDGQGVNVKGISGDGVLYRVDVTTGAAVTLAEGDGEAYPVMQPRFGAGYAWFTNQSRVYDELADKWFDVETLHRVRTDGSAAVEDIKAVKTSGLAFVATTGDDAHYLFTEGKQSPSSDAYVSLKLRAVAGGPEADVARGWNFDTRRIGDRLAVSFKSEATGNYETLVLDAAGAVVGQLPQVRLDSSFRGTFSGDGRAFYPAYNLSSSISCSASGSDVVTCTSQSGGFSGTGISIPKSSAVVIVKTRQMVGIHHPRDIEIVAP